MQANRYDRAAEAPILNTYVPINFGELYRIGKEQADTVRKASEEMSSALQKFGEFSSISDVDVQDYRDSTIGVLQGLINEAAANPDIMKDASFRSRFYTGLNSIDYLHLANLRKSAENMDTREKAKAALRAQGLYADWFDDPRYSDLRNWSTRDSGIMTNISPDKYRNMEELGREYVKDLKPTFYKGKAPNSGATMPFTNWMAISRADVRRSLSDHADDILSTTAGQRHFDRFSKMYKNVNPYASFSEIRESFIDALTTEQSDKLIETPVIDQASLALTLKQRELDAKNKGKQGDQGLPFLYPTDLNVLQADAMRRKAESTKLANPEIGKIIKADNLVDAQKIKSIYGEFAQNPITANMINAQLKILLQNGAISEQDIQNGNIGLELLQTMITNSSQLLDENDPLRIKYNQINEGIIKNAKTHNELMSTEMAYSTLRSYLNINDSSENPLNNLFNKISSSGLRGVDAAVRSTMGDLKINKPDQDLILSAVFGVDKDNKITTQTADFDAAKSSFDYLYYNYPKFRSDADEAARTQNYSKRGLDKNLTLIGTTDPSWLSWENEAFSIRNNTASGKYGNLEIVALNGYTPVQGTDPYEYAFQVTVKVPVDKINETSPWWSDYDLPEIYNDEGLSGDTQFITKTNEKGKTVGKDVDYVEVPIVINKTVPPATKFRLDAYYREQINASTELNKANEQQTAIQSPQTTTWINLR